ncbi:MULTISPECIES: hypothetical protein [unclassified Clostridium]|uniref:hypothetical protein n=1 Tax=unclassified Clostridium TaxID=2614128 RepID=UPI0002980A2E|nr:MULTISPECIES: hypothetical protein [unclassified Clostridium]EKQ54469.1 MAG: hypothetical protein A370_03294 [Clostridium sp. Maddingley MBC34-26]
MKKIAIVFIIFLLLSISLNSPIIFAQPQTKSLPQGIYIVKDANLLVNSSYNIHNTSPSTKSVIMVLDSNKALQEYIILEPNSYHYNLKPFHYDDTVVIVSNSNIDFT